MLFPTVAFAVFFVIVLAASWYLRPQPARWRLFLIGASYYFYGYWDWRFVFLLAGSTAANFFVGWLAFRAMAPGGVVHDGVIDARPGRPRGQTALSRLLVAAGVTVNLGLLGWFKYYGFFATSFVDGLGDLGFDVSVPLIRAALPIGISFFTFQGISYIVDIGRGQIRPMPALDFAMYQSFFPHLVAGPIVRASEFAPQLRTTDRVARVETSVAFTLILFGLFKKVVISSYLSSEIVDPVFAVPSSHSALEAWMAMYAYAAQIYTDFSGYTDIAIGCAMLLGIQFPQNFDAPYTATSLQDFWRRWHMTLSRWLRDYLYIGLGGNRGSRFFTYRNLMLTMVLGGLWHGAAWTFVAWGALHGGGLVVERLVNGRLEHARPARHESPWWEPLVRWAITFHVVCFAWVFFRAESFGLAWDIFHRMATGWGPAPAVTPVLTAVIAGTLAVQWFPPAWLARGQAWFSRLILPAQGVTLAFGLMVIDAFGPEGVAPFIYFRF